MRYSTFQPRYASAPQNNDLYRETAELVKHFHLQGEFTSAQERFLTLLLYLWFGYITCLSQWGGEGYFTRSNDFYLPLLRLEEGWSVSCGPHDTISFCRKVFAMRIPTLFHSQFYCDRQSARKKHCGNPVDYVFLCIIQTHRSGSTVIDVK